MIQFGIQVKDLFEGVVNGEKFSMTLIAWSCDNFPFKRRNDY